MRMLPLHVHFLNSRVWRPTELELTPCEASGFDIANLYKVHVEEEEIHNTDHSGTSSPNGTPVILKFAHTGNTASEFDLRSEAEIYTKYLSNVQGSAVPYYYGLYEGMYGGKRISFLILEDCGDPPECRLRLLPIVQRVELVRKLQAIHQCGVSHKDVRRSNVVIRDGEIRTIDFNRVSVHSCGCTVTIKKQRSCPTVSEFGCFDLWFACDEVGIWSASVRIGDSWYPEWTGRYPPQEIIDRLIPPMAMANYNPAAEQHETLVARMEEIKKQLDINARPEDPSLDMVFVAGRPYPQQGLPSQEIINRHISPKRHVMSHAVVDRTVEILKKAKDAADRDPSKDIDVLIAQGLHQARRCGITAGRAVD